MKKSEIYKVAMLSVLADSALGSETKLEIIAVLLKDSELAEFTETREAEEANA